MSASRPLPPPTDPPRQTILFFWADDVRAARRFLLEVGVDVTSEVVDVGSVSFVTFRDPDGNGLMVCQRNGTRGGK